MPKIPTFDNRIRRTQMTTQAPSVRSNIQLTAADSPFARLEPIIQKEVAYYEKKKDIQQRNDADKAILKTASNLDIFSDKLKNNSNEEESLLTFRSETQKEKTIALSNIKDKNTQRLYSSKIDLTLLKLENKIRKNSRNSLEKDIETTKDNKNNILYGEYFELPMSDTEGKKNIVDQIFENETKFGQDIGKSDVQIKEDQQKIKTFLLETDVNKLINNRNYFQARNLLKSKDTPYLDVKKRLELTAKVDKGFKEYQSTSVVKESILNKNFSTVKGAGIVNINGKPITQKDGEKALNELSLEKFDSSYYIEDERIEETGFKYSGLQVTELSVSNNIAVPIYKEQLQTGANFSTVANKSSTLAGLKIYENFAATRSLPSLGSVYNLNQKTIDSYSRILFNMRVKKLTFDQAYSNETDFQNNPQDYKTFKANDKKIISAVQSMDFPGLFTDFNDVTTARNLVKNYANSLMIATPNNKGDGKAEIEEAVKFVENNYKLDSFGNIMPRINKLPEYHDASIKIFIDKIWDMGIINKNAIKKEDIYPDYFLLGSTGDLNAFQLKDRSTGGSISILPTRINTALKFVDGKPTVVNTELLNDLTFFPTEVQKFIYVYGKDKQYEEWRRNFNSRKLLNQEYETMSTLIP
nr:ribonuclease [uncultured Mediterranean phage uvMED]